MRTGQPFMDAFLTMMAGLGTLVGRAVSYLAQHPSVAIFLATMGMSGFMAWVIVGLALLVNPMRGLYTLMYLVMAPVAVFSVESDRVLSRRLWVGILASVLGLLVMRVIYDFIGLLQKCPPCQNCLVKDGGYCIHCENELHLAALQVDGAP